MRGIETLVKTFQELLEKKTQLPDDIRWHFLGNIQSNKLSKIVESSHMIHSVSRYKIYKFCR